MIKIKNPTYEEATNYFNSMVLKKVVDCEHELFIFAKKITEKLINDHFLFEDQQSFELAKLFLNMHANFFLQNAIKSFLAFEKMGLVNFEDSLNSFISAAKDEYIINKGKIND